MYSHNRKTHVVKLNLQAFFNLSSSDSTIFVPQPCRNDTDTGKGVGSMSDSVKRDRVYWPRLRRKKGNFDNSKVNIWVDRPETKYLQSCSYKVIYTSFCLLWSFFLGKSFCSCGSCGSTISILEQRNWEPVMTWWTSRLCMSWLVSTKL